MQARASLRALQDWALASRDSWQTEDPFDLALRLTFASATKTLGAICVLTEHGYGADALKLCRSLFESMLVAYWSAFVADSSWVTTRMNEHQQFSSLIFIEVLNKHPGWLPEGERPEPTEFTIAERERLSAVRNLLRGVMVGNRSRAAFGRSMAAGEEAIVANPRR